MNSSVLFASFSSFLICLVLGFIFIPFLQRLKFGQSIRECGPQEHMKKAGTPTMGGLIMLPAIVLPVLLFTSLDKSIWLAIFLLLSHGVIGFVDDYIKVVLKRNLGLTSRQKLLAQTLIALVFIYFTGESRTDVWLPGLAGNLQLGFFYYVLVFFLLLGTTNAVNLTDGLDGLAAGATIPVALAYAVVACWQGKPSLTIFAVAIAATCCAFLVFNSHPARVFMGDTGSLALGGGIAALALLTGTELLLIVFGGLYVLEALSVIIQVVSFKTRGKRVFRMSPLHHHFELGGWSEGKIVLVFCLLSSVFSLSGLLIILYL